MLGRSVSNALDDIGMAERYSGERMFDLQVARGERLEIG